jgi:ribose transport system ATP-binding protein
MGTGEQLVTVENIHKSFRGVRALRGVSLSVARGETLALVGPNGAGKSTLVNVIAGVLQPDRGTMTVGAHTGHFSDPMHAKREGVIVVPQEVQLFPRMSSSANLSAGVVVRKRGWWTTRRSDRRLLDEIGQRLGVDLHDEDQLGVAPAEVQRLIMAGQALLEGAQVLILDEPTAGLSPHGCEAIYAALETMRTPEMAVIYVTHKFDEVSRLCDRAIVVVDGTISETFAKDELSRANLSAAVAAGTAAGGIGSSGGGAPSAASEPMPATRAAPLPAPAGGGQPAVTLRGSAQDGSDWEIPCPRGKITALAGLVDSGVEDVIRAVTGRAGATVELIEDGRRVDIGSPRAAALAGIAYVGGQRGASSFQTMSIATNIGLGKVKLGLLGLTLSRGRETALVRASLEGVGLGTIDARRALGTLSGGNQQRALFARQEFAGGRLLVVDDPTVGVDVNGRARIHEIIRKVAAAGCGVLLYSSDPEECVELADDIHVFVGGKVVSRLTSPVSQVDLVLEMSRSSAASADDPPAVASAVPTKGN